MDNPEENIEEPIPESYEEAATFEPEKEVKLEELPKSVNEEESESIHKTDIQAILQTLTPRFKDKSLNEKLQPVMVSRIFPDNLLDSCKLTVLSWLHAQNPKDNTIDVWATILATHNAHSIGFEGRGIMDRLEIAGAAHEEELEKLSKDLGL